MNGHDELRRSLGSYVVGALDPGERSRVELHLQDCATCRQEVAALAGLPGLLSRLSLQEATGSALAPPASLLPRVLAAVERERARGRRTVRRWQLAAGAVSAAAALTAVLSVVGVPGQDTEGRALVAAADVTASGRAVLEQRPWGTEVRLQLAGLPTDGGTFTAWAADAAGRRTAVATWGVTSDGSANVTGATALRPAALRTLVVTAAGGRELLRLTG